MIFKTSDGYTLRKVGSSWTDGDLTFRSDSTGHPIDDTGARLAGTFDGFRMLEEAAKLIDRARHQLNTASKTCDHCGSVRYDNFAHKSSEQQLADMARRLRAIRKELSKAPAAVWYAWQRNDGLVGIDDRQPVNFGDCSFRKLGQFNSKLDALKRAAAAPGARRPSDDPLICPGCLNELELGKYHTCPVND